MCDAAPPKTRTKEMVNSMEHETWRLTAAPADLEKAAALLRAGELVAVPTETVYGLAADALNGEAVRRIFEAKGRPADNPLIVHIAEMAAWEPLVTHIPETARRLAAAYWPGPLTLILPHAPCIPDEVSAGLPTVAVRFPSHPVAQAIIRLTGRPLAAPSANRSGSPSPTTARHVLDDMAGRIAAVVDGGDCAVGVESTVVDVTGAVPRLLRPGGVTLPMLRAVAGEVEVDPAVTHALEKGAVAASPGMKYKHYAPRAHVVLVRGTPAAYTAYVNARATERPGVFTAMCFDGEEAALTVPAVTYGRREDAAGQARQLFDALRRLDELGAKEVLAACPGEDGVGLAVYNRMLRASGFEVVDAHES